MRLPTSKMFAYVLVVAGLGAAGCTSGSAAQPDAGFPPSNGVGASLQLADRLLPRPVKGLCYVPAPSDYKSGCGAPPRSTYYDSDFYNDDFQQLWGTAGASARGDLKTLADLQVNFLHLYDWNQPAAPRNHVAFLSELQARAMRTAVPISNYFVTEVADAAQAQAWVEGIVGEVTQAQATAVVMWAIGNELDTSDPAVANKVAAVAKWILAKDSSRLITVPLKIDRLDARMTGLHDAFVAMGLAQAWSDNFIASINVYDDAAAVQVHVERFGATYPNMPLLVTELNRPLSATANDVGQQAQGLLAQLQRSTDLVADGSHPYFFGSMVFQWMAKPWACGDEDEKHFGVNELGTSLGNGTTVGGDAFPIDALVASPMLASVRQAFQ